MACKSPIELIEKEYKDTNKIIRKNAEKGKPLTEGVNTKKYDKTKKEMSKAAKKGELK